MTEIFNNEPICHTRGSHADRLSLTGRLAEDLESKKNKNMDFSVILE